VIPPTGATTVPEELVMMKVSSSPPPIRVAVPLRSRAGAS
jgi:hypothetical protein